LCFRLYQEQRDNIEKLTLEDFAMTLVSHGTDSVPSLLWQLHNLAVPVPISDNMRTSTGIQGATSMAEEKISNRIGVKDGDACSIPEYFKNFKIIFA
jgi:hypothetical protein